MLYSCENGNVEGIEVESKPEHQAQRESRTGEPGVVEPGYPQGMPLPEEYVAPGIPIVRSNTSRPLNFGASSSDFPMEAPSAAPVQEYWQVFARDGYSPGGQGKVQLV